MKQSRVVTGTAIVLLLLSAIFGPSHDSHFLWDYVPAFGAVLGYGGSWLLVVGAKSLGKRWLERDERYYGE